MVDKFEVTIPASVGRRGKVRRKCEGSHLRAWLSDLAFLLIVCPKCGRTLGARNIRNGTVPEERHLYDGEVPRYAYVK